MTRAIIPARRKHLYFYALLVLATLFIAVYKPGRSAKAQENTRASQVNKLANTLFQ